MGTLRNMIRKLFLEAYMLPPKSKHIKSDSYSDMTLKELRDKLADAEEKMVNANPHMHTDPMWSKWMRQRISDIEQEIKERENKKNIKEHYVDTSWSRMGLEPDLRQYPIKYSSPHMDMVGTPIPKGMSENAGDRTVVFSKKNNPSVEITITISRDGRIMDIQNERNIRFPYSNGQPYNRGIQTWACNNGFLMNGKDMCAEKKVFGIKTSDYPQGHPVRLLYPGKFK